MRNRVPESNVEACTLPRDPVPGADLRKPPPIRVGVAGIKPQPITLTPAVPREVDWRQLAKLPPFQQFVAERVAVGPGYDAERWASEYGVRTAAQRGSEALLAEYCAWHKAKGCWPRETPFGELIDQEEA